MRPKDDDPRGEAGALAHLAALATAVGEARAPADAFAAASGAAQRLVGHGLFTVLAFDARAMEGERVFSSDAAAYPVGGRKAMAGTAWARHVLEGGRPLIGEGADDIRTYFADHETILGLGLDMIINVPVRAAGTIVGTVNMLRGALPYRVSDLPAATVVAGLLAEPLARRTDGG